MKKFLLPLLVLGLATVTYAGDSCHNGDKPKNAACQCGAKSADDCHKHCSDKCDCTKAHCDAPKPQQETKK